jgi:hypothetical protein
MSKAHGVASVVFFGWEASITLPQESYRALELRISYGQLDGQLSSLAQVCSSAFPQALIPAVEHLYVELLWAWGEFIESSQWLELFHPFAAVKCLYIFSNIASRIALTLQELVGERVTDVLPALQTLFINERLISGPVQETIGKFVAARQLAGHPIAISRWENDEERYTADD